MKKELIKLDKASFSYQYSDPSARNEAIRDISLSIYEGEYVAIIGHNGSGKSTLAKLLNLILSPTTGTVTIDGKTVGQLALSDDELFDIRRKVGMVFQNPDDQLVATVVEEDVAFGPENLGLGRSEIRKRVDESLLTVGMTEYAHHAPHRLSGGQKQRVAIAGVLALHPKCIIYDESTSMLDPNGRKDILASMEYQNKKCGMTVIHITHHMNEAVLADRVVVMDSGYIKMDGTPEDVFSHIGEIRSMGLDIPQGTELIYELKKSGLDIPSIPLDADSCADAVISYLKGGMKK